MTIRDRDVARLMLQVERGKLTLRHLTAMARDTKLVLDLRRAELRRLLAVVAAEKAGKRC